MDIKKEDNTILRESTGKGVHESHGAQILILDLTCRTCNVSVAGGPRADRADKFLERTKCGDMWVLEQVSCSHCDTHYFQTNKYTSDALPSKWA